MNYLVIALIILYINSMFLVLNCFRLENKINSLLRAERHTGLSISLFVCVLAPVFTAPFILLFGIKKWMEE